MNATDNTFRILFLLCALALAAACQPAAGPEPGATPAITVPAEDIATEPVAPLSIPGAEPDITAPAGVVDAFYTWYLHPERTGQFHDTPYLSRRLVASVTQAREEGPLRADPFLLAQEMPAAIRVEQVAVGADTARVVLHQYWSVDPDEGTSYDLTLDLILEDGRWKIDRIQKGSPLTPHGVVQLFYNGYFAGAQDDPTLGGASYALAIAGNPLADRTYRDSPYLDTAFVARVDDLLAGSEALPAGEAYDPFLRARNHPLGFFVMTHEMQLAGDESIIPVQLSYGRQQTVIDVVVTRRQGEWRIADVQGDLPDPAASAAQVVALLADLYFQRWYAYADETGQPHAGQVDLTGFLAQIGDFFSDSPFVSPAFAAAALETLSGDDVAADPFFLSDGIPSMLEIEEAWADDGRAEVHVLQRWNQGRETRSLTVKLARSDGRWLIDGVVSLSGEAAATPPDPRAAMHPADVVRAFFVDYLAQGGFAAGAHRENAYLAPAYADSLDNDVAYYTTAGVPVERYDPILHTSAGALNDLRIEVDSVAVDEERHVALARVDRHLGAGPGAISLPLTVLLTRDWESHWSIQEIHAVDPALAGTLSAGDHPADQWSLAVQTAARYDWAVAYDQQPEKVNEIPDLLRFDMEVEGGVTFCTPTWPAGFVVEAAFIEPDLARGSRRAAVVLRTTSPHALLTLELEEREWQWAIVDQQCGDSPAGRARAFYTAYLGYPADPLQDRAYARGDYLTTDLIMDVDNALESAAPDLPEGGDPFTLTQTGVRWFHVRAGATTSSAHATLTLVDGTTRELRLTFVLVDGRWLLSSVEPAA